MTWINLNAAATAPAPAPAATPADAADADAADADADDVRREATILGSINVSQFMRILKCGLPMTNTAAATLQTHNTVSQG